MKAAHVSEFTELNAQFFIGTEGSVLFGTEFRPLGAMPLVTVMGSRERILAAVIMAMTAAMFVFFRVLRASV